MAYCCAAAFSEGETSALSMSAPQFSQPTFESWAAASSHSSSHSPSRHAWPVEVSHVWVVVHCMPAASQVCTSWPTHCVPPGTHEAHAWIAATHVIGALHVAVVCHEGELASPRHACRAPS